MQYRSRRLQVLTVCSKVFYASLFAYAVAGLISLQLCEGGRGVPERYYPEEPPVKTLVLENGDVVDCVDFYSQPAMRHPQVRKLYTNELQSRARLPPRETITEIESHGSLSDGVMGIGLKQGSCPPGSVPFLKTTKLGSLNHSAIVNFVKMRAKSFHMRSHSSKLPMDDDDSDSSDNDDDHDSGSSDNDDDHDSESDNDAGDHDDSDSHDDDDENNENGDDVDDNDDDNDSQDDDDGDNNSADHFRHNLNQHEYAVVEMDEGSFGGAQASFNVWTPFVEHEMEASISQLWLLKKHSGNRATLEAGWMVQPMLFGDHNVRFFCFTTPDNYRSWLYNAHKRVPEEENDLVFNQVSSTIFPGSVVNPSTFYGQQTEMLLKIHKDLQTGHWWLSCDGETVGFWPKANYDPDFDEAQVIHWGGEIVNRRTEERHTSTHMGNGHFGSEGVGTAAYVRLMQVYDNHLVPYDAAYPLKLYMTNPFCYDIMDWGKTIAGRMITFGGPGYNGHECV